MRLRAVHLGGMSPSVPCDHRVEMARHQHRLALAWSARDQVAAVAAGDAGECRRSRQFTLCQVVAD
jgi:hypothetical protein